MNTPSHDARREMEQRALRNVRDLVDRMQDRDQLDARRQRRMLLWLVGGIALAVAVLVVMATMRQPPREPVVLELGPIPLKKAPPK